MAITAEALVQRYPQLFHMAELGSWPLIKRYGLLSTSALLDLFEISGSEREALERRHRPESVEICHPNLGRAVVRDQKPISEERLLWAARDGGPVLRDGLTPRDWYKILNSKVFFWLTQERLERLLNAKAYRAKRHTIVIVDTKSLIAAHFARIFLSPINSGNTQPYPQPRGFGTFLPPSQYPFETWLKNRKSSGEPIAELAIAHSVPDIRNHAVRVEEGGAGSPPDLIWRRL